MIVIQVITPSILDKFKYITRITGKKNEWLEEKIRKIVKIRLKLVLIRLGLLLNYCIIACSIKKIFVKMNFFKFF